MKDNILSIFAQEYRFDTLPEKISADYDILSCLKYTESRRVYLLQHRTSGSKTILKCGDGQSGEFLQNEYEYHSSLLRNV